MIWDENLACQLTSTKTSLDMLMVTVSGAIHVNMDETFLEAESSFTILKLLSTLLILVLKLLTLILEF